jgi:Fic family protein
MVCMGVASHRAGGRARIGGIGGSTPLDAAFVAAFVPPPPERVPALMADLVAFANTSALDPVTQAAVLHAQFEAIHPFGDGNGRIGRVLIGWVLVHRLGVALPPPVSVLIARDPGGYLAGMTLYRLGQLDAWVDWLAQALVRSSEAAADLISRSESLLEAWRVRLGGVRADAAARRILEVLAEHPVLSAAVVAERLGVSVRAGQAALAVLADHGIVQRYRPGDAGTGGPGRPTGYWVASELIALVAGWTAG